MKKIFALPLLALLFINVKTYSQSGEVDSIINTGIKQIYSIEFTNAEETFRKLIGDYPELPAGRFFLAMIDWWKILLDLDNESLDDNFFAKLEDVIYQCDEILESNPKNVEALFFKGGAIGFRGRLRAIRESWLKAADDGREALPIVQRASKLDPTNMDVQLGFGIYNYYADVIPNRYPLLKPLMIFFPSGNKDQGLAQLENTAYNGKYAKYEARYFLMTLYYQFENNSYKADEFAKLLTEEFPNNPNFERWQGRIKVRMGESNIYFEIFKSVHQKCLEGKTGYNFTARREAAYYIGFYYRNVNVADSAIAYLNEAIELSKKLDRDEESGFYINAVLFNGMMHDALGKRDEAIEFYEQVLDMREYGNSRTFAKEYLVKPFSF